MNKEFARRRAGAGEAAGDGGEAQERVGQVPLHERAPLGEPDTRPMSLSPHPPSDSLHHLSPFFFSSICSSSPPSPSPAPSDSL